MESDSQAAIPEKTLLGAGFVFPGAFCSTWPGRARVALWGGASATVGLWQDKSALHQSLI